MGEGNSGQKDSGQLPEKKFYFCLFAFLLLLYLMTLSVRAVTLGGIRLSDRSPAPILLAAVPRVQQFRTFKRVVDIRRTAEPSRQSSART